MCMNSNTVIQNNRPIVTVAVITYNSARTVLETLDSVVNQSYMPENIELIISDDESKDNTVQVINEWLLHNKMFFHRVEFFINSKNGGVPINCNVAWKAASAEWIKTIAGDDILTPNCLDTFINYAQLNKNAKCIFGLLEKFPVNDSNLYPKQGTIQRKFYQLSAAQQFEALLIENLVYAPASFINRSVLETLGYADTNYNLMEDYPLWLKLTSNGFQLHLVEELVVKYRVGNSISQSLDKRNNVKFNSEVRDCKEKYSKLSKSIIKVFLIKMDCLIMRFYDALSVFVFSGKHSVFLKPIKLFSPIFVYRKINHRKDLSA